MLPPRKSFHYGYGESFTLPQTSGEEYNILQTSEQTENPRVLDKTSFLGFLKLLKNKLLN